MVCRYWICRLWFVDVVDENVTVSVVSKAYTNDLLRKTDIVPKMEILSEMVDSHSNSPVINQRRNSWLLSTKTEPNGDMLKYW